MSGGHRHAIPNNSASALLAVTIAHYGAEGWHRLAMPAPMPNLIASSARCSDERGQQPARHGELAEALGGSGVGAVTTTSRS